MKKILKAFLSKPAISTFSLFIHIGIITCAVVIPIVYYEAYISFLIILGLFIYTIITVFFILNRKDMHPHYKIAWIIFSLLLLGVGATIYYIYYFSVFNRKMRKISEECILKRRILFPNNADINKLDNEEKILSINNWPTYNDSKIELIYPGEVIFKRIFEDLEKATNFILVQFFIVKDDNLQKKFVETLAKKASEGLDVYFIYDDFGAAYMPRRYHKKLRKLGIKASPLNQLKINIRSTMNYRYHRKQVIIDGKIAYTGGFNLADEYVNVNSRFGYWFDGGVRLEGNCVRSMVVGFFEDVIMESKKRVDTSKYLVTSPFFNDDNFITPYSDSPIENAYNAKSIFLSMFWEAEKRIDISCPYLILDYETIDALQLCTRRGVEVNILIPKKPDKKLIYWITNSFATDLAKYGVNIYYYNPGFNHFKAVLVDGKKASIGTTNFDFRSFYLNLENNIYFRDKKTCKELEKMFKNLFSISKKTSYEELSNLNFFEKLFQTFLRAFSAFV